MLIPGVLTRAACAAACFLPVCPASAEPVELPVGPAPVVVRWDPPLLIANPDGGPGAVIQHSLRLPGAAWLRPHLEGTVLPRGATLRVTSLADGSRQEFDQEMLDRWEGCTAYFNGDSLVLEVVASGPLAAGGAALRLTAVEVSPPVEDRGGPGQVGICDDDERQPSTEAWVARLMPVQCTASIICSNSTALSAGHCAQPNLVLQFRVPPTTAGCTLVMPPPEDQFPAALAGSQNAGIGADWAVYTTGTNTIGQTAFERMGSYGLISSEQPAFGSAAVVYGYGQDLSCVRQYTQQSSPGDIVSASATTVFHSCDIRVGSSGSPIVVNGRVVGVATHANECANICTSVRATAFAAAIAARTCPVACDSVDFNRDTLFPDEADIGGFLEVFSGGPCPGGAVCGDIDFNNDGIFPDTLDIQAFLSVFSGGACLR